MPFMLIISALLTSRFARAMACGVGLFAAHSLKWGLESAGRGAPKSVGSAMGLMAPLMFPQTGSSSHPSGMTFPKLSMLLFIRYNITQVRLFVKRFLQLFYLAKLSKYWLQLVLTTTTHAPTSARMPKVKAHRLPSSLAISMMFTLLSFIRYNITQVELFVKRC